MLCLKTVMMVSVSVHFANIKQMVHINYGFYFLDSRLATSELCQNRQIAKVTEILWLHENNRGCCLMPLQSIQSSSWISFPDAPGLRPFNFGKIPESLERSLSLDRHGLLRLLVETETTPCYDAAVWQKDVVRVSIYVHLYVVHMHIYICKSCVCMIY